VTLIYCGYKGACGDHCDRKRSATRTNRETPGHNTLHRSKSLCKLLQYLAKDSWEHPGTSLRSIKLRQRYFDVRTTLIRASTPWCASRRAAFGRNWRSNYGREGLTIKSSSNYLRATMPSYIASVLPMFPRLVRKQQRSLAPTRLRRIDPVGNRFLLRDGRSRSFLRQS